MVTVRRVCELLRRRFGGEPGGGEVLGGGEGIGSGRFDVGRDAGSLPAGVGDGINGGGERDADFEMGVDAMARDGMGAASGDFADDGGAFLLLEIVGEFFAAGESAMRRENVGWLRREAFAGDVRQRPELLR